MSAKQTRDTSWGVIVLMLLGGILIPFLVGFTEITLRNAVAGFLQQPYLTVASFTFLLAGYFLGFELLWKWLLRHYAFENPFYLLRLATLALIGCFLVQFGFLFQPENLFSNLIWLLFFAIAASFFYLIGRMRINRF